MFRPKLEPKWFQLAARITLASFFISFILLPSGMSRRVMDELFPCINLEYKFPGGYPLFFPLLNRDFYLRLLESHAKQMKQTIWTLLMSWPGLVFLCSSIAMIILPVYWDIIAYDLFRGVNTHLIYAHDRDRPYNKSREHDQYWKHATKSREATRAVCCMLAFRLSVCFMCSIVFKHEAGFLLLRHVLKLCTALMSEPWHEDLRACRLLFEVCFRMIGPVIHSHYSGTMHAFWFLDVMIVYPAASLLYCLFQVEVAPSNLWINYFPCHICDNRGWPDMWIVAVSPDCKKLADFQEDKCSHCWMDWAAGDITAVYKCGHVFHQECNDQWLPMRGRHICSVCRFPAERLEYEEIPKIHFSDEDWSDAMDRVHGPVDPRTGDRRRVPTAG